MAIAPPEHPKARSTGARRLFTLAAVVAILVMFAGFAPTYYLRGLYGTAELDALRQVHGIVMTAWFALFLVQSQLVARDRIAAHRMLGVAGALLALLVVIMGTSVGIVSARSGVNPAGVPPQVFLVLPLGEMLTFACLVGTAIALRKHSDYHKRFMLLATLAMLAPAIARLHIGFVQRLGPPGDFALTDLLILACVAYDTAGNRRLHPAFVGGFALVVVVQFGRLAISQTPLWNAFATWLIG